MTPPSIRGSKQFRIIVVGDGTQQAAIINLVGPRRQERLHIQARAQLVLQPDQVEVSIQGQQLGHLSRSDTRALHRIVRYGERSSYETFDCAALITGTVGAYSVRVDLPFED
jgi:hypothetical protein